MWAYEHSETAEVSAQSIWKAWCRVEEWGSWNSDIEAISIDGPFAEGTTFSMKPFGQDPVRMRLAEVAENEVFSDVTEIDGVVIRTSHRITPAGDGSLTITYRMEITGPGSDTVGPELGPQISADFPETISALIKHAAAL
jgi:hypothetical protein